MTAKDLYDHDFLEWTRCNAALLRAGRFGEADILHIAEEIEDMGKRERREMLGRLAVLLTHLLKYEFQPDRRSSSWIETIGAQRIDLDLLLADNPSLKVGLQAAVDRMYPIAVRQAARETALARGTFPVSCPYSVHEILDGDFFPK